MLSSTMFLFSLTLAVLWALPLAGQYTFEDREFALNYAKMDQDIRDIEVFLNKKTQADFNKAAVIYANGKYTKPCTVKKVSTGAQFVYEPMFKMFLAHWKSPKYSDVAITQIFQKKGPQHAIVSVPC